MEELKRRDSNGRFARYRCADWRTCTKQHYFPSAENFCRGNKEEIAKDAEIVRDDLPPRCSTPDPDCDSASPKIWQADSLEDRQYAYWANEFNTNVGTIANSNGLVSGQVTPPWFPRFTYNQSPTTSSAKEQQQQQKTPEKTSAITPPRGAALLSYLQRPSRKVSPETRTLPQHPVAPAETPQSLKPCINQETPTRNYLRIPETPEAHLMCTRYIAQSRIFPQIVLPVLHVNQEQINLLNPYAQYCETVQYRQVPSVNYNQRINVNSYGQWY